MSDAKFIPALTPNDKKLILAFVLITFAINAVVGWISGSFMLALAPLPPTVLLIIVIMALRRKDLDRSFAEGRQNFVQQQIWTDLAPRLQTRLPLPPLREGAASPDLIALLFAEIESRKPSLMLECGSGVSTLVLGYILQNQNSGARLISLEHDLLWFEKVSAWIRLHNLQETVTLLYAPLLPVSLENRQYHWYDTTHLKEHIGSQKFDLIFVDGPPVWLHQQSRTGIITLLPEYVNDSYQVIVDDALRPKDRQSILEVAKHMGCTPEFISLEKGAAILNSSSADGS